jgi:hypothetical protein
VSKVNVFDGQVMKIRGHIIGIVVAVASVALLWMKAIAWSFPVPGNDAIRQGTARTLEMVGSRIDGFLRLPVSSLTSHGTATWACGSVFWGLIGYGIVLLVYRLMRSKKAPNTPFEATR